MRKSIDGLCAVIQDQLQMNPSGSSLFLFCGRRCDRIKGLLKEPDGYVLIYKRLTAQYGRYRWLRNEFRGPRPLLEGVRLADVRT